MSLGTQLAALLRTPLKGYQLFGVRFAIAAAWRALIADDMGLGKTIQAVALIALYLAEVERGETKGGPVIVVCPASVKFHWQRELRKHAGIKSHVCEGFLTTATQDARDASKACMRARRGKGWQKRTSGARKAILTAIRRRFARKQEAQRPRREASARARVLILNYEILASWLPHLLSLRAQFVVLDEVHYCSSRTSQRTKAAGRLTVKPPRLIELSGTPLQNGPVEFWPPLRMLRPGLFKDFYSFAFRYCAPKRGFRGQWDFRGASNLKGLHRKVAPFMIRRLKSEVLTELPEKQRTVIPVEISNKRDYSRAKDDFLAWLRGAEGPRAVRLARGAMALVRMGKLLSLAALGKMRAALSWLEDFIEESDRSIVVYGIHTPVMDALRKAYPDAPCIVGGTPLRKRRRAVDRFRRGRAGRVFLGQMRAAGTGTDGLQERANATLTLELPYNPALLDQSEDRVLRIGQDADAVDNYYLVGRGTLEEWLLGVLHDKGIVVDEVLSGRRDGDRKSMLELMESIK